MSPRVSGGLAAAIREQIELFTSLLIEAVADGNGHKDSFNADVDDILQEVAGFPQ